MKSFIVSIFILIALPLGAADFGANDIQKMQWGDLEVVWLEDNRFPTYHVSIYFGDGALSDGDNERGMTTAMFSLLASGTRRFDQKAIADNLEYFGASYSGNATHEHSTYTVSGLVKDIVPTMKKICHLFDDATFPEQEIEKYKKISINGLKTMVNSHGPLANRIFRELSLEGTPFSYPVGGKLKDFKFISQKKLKQKLNYFNKEVKKRVYLYGPKPVLNIEKIITTECGWTGQGKFVRNMNYNDKSPAKTPRIYLVTVPKANQAQVRMGRFLNKSEIENPELLTLMSDFIGGGFTSVLMQELRVNRGLTYSVGAFAAGQKAYGRAQIATFTKNQTLGDLLNVTKQVLTDLSSGKVHEKQFEFSRRGLVGSYPFRFEDGGTYLSQLMMLDHIGKPYSELYKFQERVKNFSIQDVSGVTKNIFGWDSQVIVVVGAKSLLDSLKKFGNVKVVSYKSYL